MTRIELYKQQALEANLATMLFRVIAAQLKRSALRVAILGSKCGNFMNFGEIVLADERVNVTLTYFGERKDFYLLSYAELNPIKFDCYIVIEDNEQEGQAIHNLIKSKLDPVVSLDKTVINWNKLKQAVESTLSGLDDAHTCLNYQKLFALAAAIQTTPSLSALIECGVFKGGGTVFLGMLSKNLGKPSPIFALDTFEGLPPPSVEDTSGGVHYPGGFFNETSLEGVKSLYARFGLSERITPIKGLVQNTIPSALANLGSGNIVAFLDMDQYGGIYAAVDALLSHSKNNFVIFIDDTTIPGVDEAISDACNGRSIYRARITHNFDLLVV